MRKHNGPLSAEEIEARQHEADRRRKLLEGKSITWQIEAGFVSWQDAVATLEDQNAGLRERVDGALRHCRAVREGTVEPLMALRRIENVLTVPHVHPSSLKGFEE